MLDYIEERLVEFSVSIILFCNCFFIRLGKNKLNSLEEEIKEEQEKNCTTAERLSVIEGKLDIIIDKIL